MKSKLARYALLGSLLLVVGCVGVAARSERAHRVDSRQIVHAAEGLHAKLPARTLGDQH